MIAYRFLGLGGVDLLTRWPWFRRTGETTRISWGCRVAQLSHWIGPELWALELSGDVDVMATIVTAEHVRLLGPVPAWDEVAMREYLEACAWHARQTAVTALGASGEVASSDALGRCDSLAAVRDEAAAIAAATQGIASRVAAYAADAAGFGLADLTQARQVPFVAAHTAGHAAGPEGSDAYRRGYDDEKGRQADWLARRLHIADDHPGPGLERAPPAT